MYLMRFLDVTLDTYQDHIKIHAKYMQDTCTIHRIRILITNVPKFDNKCTVTPPRRAPMAMIVLVPPWYGML